MKEKFVLLRKLNKKQLLIVFILGIALLLIPSGFSEKQTEGVEEELLDYATYIERLEGNLEKTLGRMYGVSDVDVMITLKSGFEFVPAYEAEKNAGAEEQKFIVLKKKGGSEEAFVLKEQFPEIQGVLVIAKGVGNGETERNIIEAVKTVFNISSSRVKVLEK